MDCPHIPQIDRAEFARALASERRPYAAMLEITQRCNNVCVHCYLDPAGRTPDPDPPLEFLLELLDVLREEQCLWMAFTGGEPLLRDDFVALYEAVKRRGILPTVYTNARLITDETVDMFHELPPKSLSISIYGATAPTYDAVSRVPGSFDQAMRGIDRVHARGLRAHLKTMVLRSNYHELDAMAAIADDLGWQFFFDAGVTPTIEGGTHVLAERVDPEMMVELDLRFPDRRQAWLDLCQRPRSQQRGSQLFSCSAGRTNVFIGASGTIHPCVAAYRTAWTLDRQQLAESFRTIFYHELPATLQQTSDNFPCATCTLHHVCATCTAWRQLEVGSGWLPCEFGCRVAELRAQAFGLDGSLPDACQQRTACEPTTQTS